MLAKEQWLSPGRLCRWPICWSPGQLFSRATPVTRCFAITVFVLAGAFMLPANVGYFFYVGPQSARIEATLAKNPAEFLASEEVHLDKMMRGFQRSYRLDGAVALAGTLLATIGLLVRNNKYVGTGLAVALCAATLLAGEIWSKHRALQYREALLLNVADRVPQLSRF